MRLLSLISANQVCAALCVALALLFAGSSLSSAVDRIQHAPGASPTHEHMVLSDFSLEDVDDRGHQQPDPDDQDPADHLAGGHHHHGDNGAGLIALASADAILATLPGDAHGLAPDRPAVGFRIQGPERPPKPSTNSA